MRSHESKGASRRHLRSSSASATSLLESRLRRRSRCGRRPGGRVVARIGARTEFGSPQTLAVAFRKGEWIAVRSPALRNRQLGWLRAADRPASEAARPDRGRPLQAHALRRRGRGRPQAGRGCDRLLRDANAARRVLRHGQAARPGLRFRTTDAASSRSQDGSRTCPRAGRAAIASRSMALQPRTTAKPATNGCLHLPGEVLRYLMRDVPLGTPVHIRA